MPTKGLQGLKQNYLLAQETRTRAFWQASSERQCLPDHMCSGKNKGADEQMWPVTGDRDSPAK